MKKLISIDLDGVLNNYTGDYKEKEIPSAKDGAEEFLAELSEYFIIDIFTVRDKNLVTSWLKENNLIQYINNVTNIKNPKTSLFIDDRAINFNGNFSDCISQIKNFTPYWKKK